MSGTVRPGFFAESARLLALCDPAAKCDGVAAFAEAVASDAVRWDPEVPLPPADRPGRPERPERVAPAAVPRRRLGSQAGRIALVHAIAHIEFNAINLALDAAARFRDMPADYYPDWVSVAADEARHFGLMANRLTELGSGYGALPAHDGLWEMARDTVDSCLVRMALVPRVLEARGLDVTPGMIERLRAVGDEETVAALEVILREEVRHVAIGSRWFRYCCEREQLDPEATFRRLLRTRYSGQLRGPFNLPARRAAGFSKAELGWLDQDA
ncbi:ferritin-like domain-containing protein [Elongatibacter sediminis]|uniref:Ferritin-like domain-containing protein n=1 Tax=Elongatibacter sediminis TaxID=3119006 RepID=A0AAW9RF22_9GAMM